jgi:hypothetical protein
MTKLKISELEKSVMVNIRSLGASKSIPQNIITNIKSNQIGAVVNNMISKGLVIRQKDLFGTNIQLTRSGKIQSTKLVKLLAA